MDFNKLTIVIEKINIYQIIQPSRFRELGGTHPPLGGYGAWLIKHCIIINPVLQITGIIKLFKAYRQRCF